MAQTQTTINALVQANALGLQDEFELDQFVGPGRRSRKATLQQLAALLSGAASPIIKISTVDSPYNASILLPIILVDATLGPVTINLPAITNLTPQFKVKKLDGTGNLVDLVPQGGDTIEGLPNFTLAFAGQAVEPLPYVPDSNWNNF